MTDDMQSSFGVISDGNTLKTLDEVIQLDKGIGQTEDSVTSFSGSLLEMEKTAAQAFDKVGLSADNNLLALDRIGRNQPDSGGGSGGGGSGGGGQARGLNKGARGLTNLSQAASLLGNDAGAATGRLAGMGSQVIGLADSVSQMGISMGPVGIAATVATVALGVFAADGMGDVKDASEELVKQLQEQASFERSLLDAKQMTSAEIENELADIESRIEGEKEYAAVTQANADAINEATAETGLFGQALLTAGDIMQTGVRDPLTEVNKVATDQAKIVSDLETEYKGLTEALSSSEVAANDATEALLDNLDKIEDTRKFEQEALAGSAEENQKRAESIANEKAIIAEQISVLEASGDESQKAQDSLAELNSEMETLNQQSDILSSSAVKAAESQKALAETEEELGKVAEKSQKELEAAVKKTIQAQEKEAEARAETAKVQNEVRVEQTELVAAQLEELADEREDAYKAEMKAERDFRKDKKKLFKNQSFLEAIDAQDAAVEQADKRRDERADDLADLQEDLIEEREMKALDAAETIADSEKSLAEARNRTIEAAQDEQKIRSDSARSILELQNERFNIEMQGYQQMTDIVAQFTAQMKASLSGLTEGVPGGGQFSPVGNAGKSQLTSQLQSIFSNPRGR